jgi:hypothetical protein
MIAAYLLGVGTPIIPGYIGLGVYIMVQLWSQTPSAHWMSQYRSPFAKPPLPVTAYQALSFAIWLKMLVTCGI